MITDLSEEQLFKYGGDKFPPIIVELSYSISERMYSVRFFPGVKHPSKICTQQAKSGSYIAFEEFEQIKKYIDKCCLCNCQSCREAVIDLSMSGEHAENLGKYLLLYKKFIENAGVV